MPAKRDDGQPLARLPRGPIFRPRKLSNQYGATRLTWNRIPDEVERKFQPRCRGLEFASLFRELPKVRRKRIGARRAFGPAPKKRGGNDEALFWAGKVDGTCRHWALDFARGRPPPLPPTHPRLPALRPPSAQPAPLP